MLSPILAYLLHLENPAQQIHGTLVIVFVSRINCLIGTYIQSKETF